MCKLFIFLLPRYSAGYLTSGSRLPLLGAQDKRNAMVVVDSVIGEVIKSYDNFLMTFEGRIGSAGRNRTVPLRISKASFLECVVVEDSEVGKVFTFHLKTLMEESDELAGISQFHCVQSDRSNELYKITLVILFITIKKDWVLKKSVVVQVFF